MKHPLVTHPGTNSRKLAGRVLAPLIYLLMHRGWKTAEDRHAQGRDLRRPVAADTQYLPISLQGGLGERAGVVGVRLDHVQQTGPVKTQERGHGVERNTASSRLYTGLGFVLILDFLFFTNRF